MVVIAFIAGLFVGVAGDRVYLFRSRQLMDRHRPQFVSRRVVERIDRELHLSPQQRSAVQQAVERHHARIGGIMNGLRPQMRQEVEAANAEIEKVLTPEQREKFGKMRMHIRGRERRERR